MRGKRVKLHEVVSLIRTTIMDIPEHNRLLGYQVEFTDEEIIHAIDTGLDFINFTGEPELAYDKYNITPRVRHILVDAAVVELMDMMIAQKARNTIVVNDGGATVNREGNIDLYRIMKMERQQRAEIKLSEMKFKINFNTY